MTRAVTVAVMALALTAAEPAAQAPTASDLFLEAMQMQERRGEPAKAIELFRAVVDRATKSDRPLAARALLQIGICSETLGRPEARAAYERVVSEFADVVPVVAEARKRLAALPPSREVPSAMPFEQPFSPNQNWDVSPDGTMVVGLRVTGSLNRPDAALVARDLSTGLERVLAPGLNATLARVRFSPDGRKVAAFLTAVTGRTGGTARYNELVVATLAPQITRFSIATAMTFEDAIALWSPDGRWLPYLAPAASGAPAEARLLNVDTGDSTPLGVAVARRPDFQWSAPGTELALHVAKDVDSTGEIHIIDVSTGRRRVVPMATRPELVTRLRGWTRDGQIVVQRADRSAPRVIDPSHPNRPSDVEIAVLSPATGRLRTTCVGAPPGGAQIRYAENAAQDLCLDLTGSGLQIVWEAQTKRLLVRNAASGSVRRLTGGSGEEHFPFLSPDDRIQVFVSNRDGKWGLYAAVIDQAPVQQPVRLAPLDGLPYAIELRWTREGFVVRVQYRESNIYRVDMDPATGRAKGTPVRLTQHALKNSRPRVSPDSKRIAYWITEGQSAFATMDADGENERVISERRFNGTPYLAWRSAEKVLLTAQPPGERTQMRLSIDARTGVIETLAVPLFDERGWGGMNWDYSRARDEVVYLVNDAAKGVHTFRGRSLEDGADRVLATVEGAGTKVSDYFVSHDGRRLAYALEQAPRQVGVIDLTTGARRALSGLDALPLGWSPDGRFVLPRGDRPVVFDTVNGQSWPLFDLTAGPWSAAWIDWSPDGSFLVFEATGGRTEWRQWHGVTVEALDRLRAPRR